MRGGGGGCEGVLRSDWVGMVVGPAHGVRVGEGWMPRVDLAMIRLICWLAVACSCVDALGSLFWVWRCVIQGGRESLRESEEWESGGGFCTPSSHQCKRLRPNNACLLACLLACWSL